MCGSRPWDRSQRTPRASDASTPWPNRRGRWVLHRSLSSTTIWVDRGLVQLSGQDSRSLSPPYVPDQSAQSFASKPRASLAMAGIGTTSSTWVRWLAHWWSIRMGPTTHGWSMIVPHNGGGGPRQEDYRTQQADERLECFAPGSSPRLHKLGRLRSEPAADIGELPHAEAYRPKVGAWRTCAADRSRSLCTMRPRHAGRLWHKLCPSLPLSLPWR